MTLQLQDVTVRYGTGQAALTAANAVSITVPRGSTLGLVGESGCGKSSLAKAIVGLAPIVGGRLLLDDVDVTARPARSLAFRRRVQLVFQDPYASLNPRMTVAAALTEAVRNRAAVKPTNVHDELQRVLDLVRLPRSALPRYPHQFSGGQRQRIAIARALAIGPELLICDEVTSALDVSVQATILNLLKRLQAELHLTYLFISHDLSVVRYMSERIAVMYLGQVVEQAPASEIFASPQHPYTRVLLASVPRIGAPRPAAPVSGDVPDPRRPPAGCRFHTRCPVGPLANPERTICWEEDPQVLSSARRHQAACLFVDAVSAHG